MFKAKLDPSVHPVAFSVDDLGLIPIYDVVERDSMICDCRLVLFTGKRVPLVLRNVNNNKIKECI